MREPPAPPHFLVRPCQNSNLCYFYVASLLDTKQADMKPRAVQYTYCVYCKYVVLRCSKPKEKLRKIKDMQSHGKSPPCAVRLFVCYISYSYIYVLKPVPVTRSDDCTCRYGKL